MAKNIGPIQFTGKLGGLSGRNTAFGNVIQTPGGFKSERLKNDLIYLKSRQCSAEFAHCSKTAALFRQQLLPYLQLLPDPYVYNHIQKRVLVIKDCDPTSPKGSKTFNKGLSSESGEALLRNFSFNRKRQFYFAGIPGHSIDIEKGRLTLDDVNPNMFDFPGTANAVVFQLILLGVDLSVSALTTSACFIVKKTDIQTSISLEAEIPCAGTFVAVLFIGACRSAEGAILWMKHESNVLQVMALGQKL
ncbi:hypothetical protein FNO01nite_28330 [Flavobacterium noncentrifugens]|uniref:Uncharacterized protein n=1 Tax=Flavobacterium noncentrifugens TaxID=1128970 RepID=A0A1G9CUV9_9FLAO|nr:hypothetical protein [Flavobacterium noncentrifugens]GEP52161.1 hypothetical protein FNO01nite_28330 [Flavobacterium noncentrifugens]SDK55426.1 hypothetical protein SAMN04487935_3661 [Flavobacterium noncentrifugens]